MHFLALLLLSFPPTLTQGFCRCVLRCWATPGLRMDASPLIVPFLMINLYESAWKSFQIFWEADACIYVTNRSCVINGYVRAEKLLVTESRYAKVEKKSWERPWCTVYLKGCLDRWCEWRLRLAMALFLHAEGKMKKRIFCFDWLASQKKLFTTISRNGVFCSSFNAD